MSGLSWAEYAPWTLAAYATYSATDTRHFSLLEVKPKAAATQVAEGAAKPEVVQALTSDIQLVKYGGYAHVSVECLTYEKEAERLIADVLLYQLVMALDSDLVKALDAKNTAVTTTSKGAAAILEAQTALMALGAIPTAVALAPADYAKLLSQNNGGQYLNFSSPELGSRGLLFGMALVPSAQVKAGNAYVFDSRGLVVAEHAMSPQLYVSGMTTSNMCDMVADLFAVAAVATDAAVAKVPLTF